MHCTGAAKEISNIAIQEHAVQHLRLGWFDLPHVNPELCQVQRSIQVGSIYILLHIPGSVSAVQPNQHEFTTCELSTTPCMVRIYAIACC